MFGSDSDANIHLRAQKAAPNMGESGSTAP
jgi:hypothetical protein